MRDTNQVQAEKEEKDEGYSPSTRFQPPANALKQIIFAFFE